MQVSLETLIAAARALNAIAAVDEAELVQEGVFPDGSAPLVHVKDNIAVRGLPWTAGSPLFAGVEAPRDAAAVRLLREAGGRISAKTTLHELAFGVTGANGWTGAIVNPIDPTRVAGGSSGGGAAALGVGLGDLALVTDTGGSARIPAAFCGLLGFRPSTGRYPADGLIGLSPSRDTIGLMAREMRWIDWADSLLSGEGVSVLPYPARIGIATAAALGEMEPDVAEAYRHLGASLVEAGHEVLAVDIEPLFAADEECGFVIALYETQTSLRAMVPTLTGHRLEEALSAVATPDVAHSLAVAMAGEAVTPARYADAIGTQWPSLRRAADALFVDGIDFLLLPTTPMTAPPLHCGEMVELSGQSVPTFPTLTRFTRPDSMAGLPAISLPYGRDRAGLPIGMMFSAARGADRRLIAFARDLLTLPEFS